MGTVAWRCVACRSDSHRRNSLVNSAQRMRLYDVRTPNSKRSWYRGLRNKRKKKQIFFSGWLRAPDDGGDYQVTKTEYTRRKKRVKEKTLRGRYSCVELLIWSVVMGASGDWSVGPGTARSIWKDRRRSRHSVLLANYSIIINFRE